MLLEQETYDYLTALAEEKGISISELIRKAIRQEYLTEKEKILRKGQRMFEKILKV